MEEVSASYIHVLFNSWRKEKAVEFIDCTVFVGGVFYVQLAPHHDS
jgi:hypothetical protein